MTSSYNKSTPDPQEPEQLRPGAQPPQNDATQRLNPNGSPMRIPDSVRPGAMPPIPPWNVGPQFIAPTQAGRPMNAVPGTPNPPSLPGMPAPSANSHNQGGNNYPGPQFFPPSPGMPATNGPDSHGWPSNGPGGGALQSRQPMAVSAMETVPRTPSPNPQSGIGLQGSPFPPAQPQPGINNGYVILYRSPNFFVSTVNRTSQKVHPLRKPSGYTAVMPKVMPQQEKTVSFSETRLLPNVTLDHTTKKSPIPLPAWLEALFVIIFLAASSVAHAYNMFNFPRYELDEGTYISNAWAITQGALSPYPYGYGHPPMAWIQLAGWIQLTGGLFNFGNALNTGRVFMLFYAVGCSLLVYLIVSRMSGSRVAGLLALAIFSFSPLGLTYQRQIYLDNIATFWLLLSLYLLVISRSRLLYIILAGLAFGICFLSKEVFVVALPGMIYAAWLYTTKFQRKFGLVAFIYTILALCSTFVLLAVLKGELFPYSWKLPGDTHQHLSILDTFVGQAQRGQTGGSFIQSWITWTANDPLFIALSVVFPAFNLICGWWNRKNLMLALLSISFWLLLARGGQVLSFYIIPLIPITAINTVMALNSIFGWAGKLVRFDLVRAILLFAVLAVVLPYDVQQASFLFSQHPTSAQNDAMVWVRANVPHNSFIVINSYLYMDLHAAGGAGVGDGAIFPHAEVYWNVAYDPELSGQALDGNWDRIDYIVADSEMLNDIKTYGGPMNLIKDALDHSVQRAEFRADDHNLQIVVQVFQVIHKSPQPVVDSGGNLAVSTPGITGPPVSNPLAWTNSRKIMS